MVHVHGFAISGTYLTPTAELLTDTFRVYIPDLPGFGRSPKPAQPLGIVELGHRLASLHGRPSESNGHSGGQLPRLRHHRRTHRPGTGEGRTRRSWSVRPAAYRTRPLPRAIGQMARDGVFEPPTTRACGGPDYLRFGVGRAIKLFSQMTKYPAYERFMAMPLPVLVVIGSLDPLRPSWRRISQVMSEIPPGCTIVLFQGAAHAINFSHPRELAHLIRQYVAGEEIRMDAGNAKGVPVLEL